jgi:hypothetical protein
MAKTDAQAERTWLGLAVTFLLAGSGLILAADHPYLSDPAFYVGIGLSVLGVWIAIGVFWATRFLPKLPSERRAETVRSVVEGFVIEGNELYQRVITDDDEWARLQTDYQSWSQHVQRWLAEEISQAASAEFANPSFWAADVIGSFVPNHTNMRLRIQAQVKQLWGLLG